MDNLIAFLSKLGPEKFYGVVEIVYQAGEVTLVYKKQSYKYKDLV